MKYSLIIIGCLLFFNCIISCSDRSKTAETEGEYPEVEDVIPEAPSESLEEILAKYPEESFDERFESMNPWRKGYFKNEWDEDMSDKPYMYTTLSGTGWDIYIGYESALSSQTASGVFGFSILDEHGKSSMYGPVNILVRGTDGETKALLVTRVDNGVAYVADPAEVESFKNYLNTDQFDILLEFEKYNERHKTQAHWWSDPGFFQEAIDKLLN